MPLQSQETDPSSRPQPGTHHFLIQAEPEASVLSRVLELFALRSLLPTEVNCKRAADQDGELHIRIAMPGLPPEKAAHLAARMRNIIPVTRVVLEHI
ncbi:MAG: hypothetical protein HQ502_14470 [Alphaproteobacteria bacterium]|nr:hypothetical protein [Alphaproteobacteria bacterium]